MATVGLGTNMVATPSSAAVATTSNYVSSAHIIASGDTGAALHQRDVDEQLVKRYGNQGITGLMELLGSKKETKAKTFEHYEETLLHNSFTGSFHASDGTLTIASGDRDGLGNTAMREGDLLIGNSGTMFYVAEAMTQPDHAAICKDMDGALAVSTDTTFAIVGNAYAEQTDQPTGITPSVHHYSNKCQIIKESFIVSGSEATNAVYVKVNSPESGTGYLWYLQGEADTYQRFMDYSELAMIVGDAGDGTLSNVDTDTNGTGIATGVTTTEGLLQFMEGKGQSMDLGSSAITMADLGFNSFSRGGYTFHKKTYDLFNRPDLLGAATFKYNGFGMCIPMDSQKDAKSGEKIPSLRMRYKAANGYSREMEHWLTGGAVLQNKTNGLDELKCNYRTERGFEGFAPNRFLLFKKS